VTQFSAPVEIGTVNAAASDTTIVITLAAAAPAGSLVVTTWQNQGSLGITGGVVDSRSNTYATQITQGAGGLQTLGLTHSVLTTDLQIGDTITATIGGGSAPNRCARAFYVTGSVASPLDQTVKNTANNNTTFTTATSSTLAQADELVVVVFSGGNTATINPSSISGYTQFADILPGNNRCHASAWKTVSDTTGVNATVVWNTTENNSGWILVTFKAAAAAAATTVFCPSNAATAHLLGYL
jgi:hypothetical protein